MNGHLRQLHQRAIGRLETCSHDLSHQLAATYPWPITSYSSPARDYSRAGTKEIQQQYRAMDVDDHIPVEPILPLRSPAQITRLSQIVYKFHRPHSTSKCPSHTFSDTAGFLHASSSPSVFHPCSPQLAGTRADRSNVTSRREKPELHFSNG